MDQQEFQISPRQTYALLNLVWAFFVVLILVFFIISLILRRPPIDSLNLHISAVIMGIFSIMILVFQGKLRGNLADGRLFPRLLDLDSWGLNPKAAGKLRVLELPERAQRLMLQAHVVFRTLIWLTAVVMASFGLVLTLLGGRFRFMVLFGVVALTVMFFNYPSYPMFSQQEARWKGFLETKAGKRILKKDAASFRESGDGESSEGPG